MAEENMTAGSRAWDLIMGTADDPSEGSSFRGVLLFILLAGICLSGYIIYLNRQYVPPQVVMPERQVAADDIKRLDTMIKNLNVVNDARKRSMEIANASESIGRYPFVATRDIPVDTQEAADIVAALPQEVTIEAPMIEIKGTMMFEGKAAAILDIYEDPDKRIFKVGDSFADNKGRVTGISLNKVTVTYEGKRFTYPQ